MSLDIFWISLLLLIILWILFLIILKFISITCLFIYPNYSLLQDTCHIITLVSMDTMQSPVLEEKQSRSVCLVDHVTTHSIQWDKIFFMHLSYSERYVTMILDTAKRIMCSRTVSILQPIGQSSSLYSPQSQCNLLSVRDKSLNEFHIKVEINSSKEFL